MSEQRTRIDDAIDRAVRDIMRHDPAAGFRRRVLARLDAPGGRAFLWPAVAAAAAVAILAVAAFVLRDTVQRPTPAAPDVAARIPEQPPVPPVTRPDRTDAPPVIKGIPRTPREEPVRTATFGPREGRVSATSLGLPRPTAAAAGAAAASDPPAAVLPPIVVLPLTPLPPLEVAPIVVAPIQVPLVQLTPVSPPR